MYRSANTAAMLLGLAAVCANASAQVFMAEADALKIIAPQAAWSEEVKTLDDTARQTLAQSSRLRFAELGYRFQVGHVNGQISAYALTLDEIGKTEPITFTVGLDASGKVTEVILLVFRESRGAEVRDPRFLKQFHNKTRRDPVQINRDILNYAGATLSSQALARGVRKTLALFEHFYGANGKRAAKAGESPNHVILSPFASLRVNSAKDLLLPYGKEQLQMLRPDQPAPASLGGPGIGTQHDRPGDSRYIQARYLMGTVCAIEVYASDRNQAERAVNAAFAAVQEVDRRMSNYRPESELSLLNQHAGTGPVPVSEELFEVLSLAQRVSEASDGAFDVTVAPLLRAWGFLPVAGGPPSPVPIGSGHPLPGGEGRIDGENSDPLPQTWGRGVRGEGANAIGYRHIILDAAARTVRFALPGIEIDLGGIAKGYAVDRAVAALRAGRIENARVSAGGSTIYALGTSSGSSRGWPLMLPSGDTIFLRDQAASTSGHSEKFVEINGRRYSHIFDPRRGQPVSTESSTVTVLAPTAMESDALTKPFFILNSQEQKRLRRHFPAVRVWIEPREHRRGDS